MCCFFVFFSLHVVWCAFEKVPRKKLKLVQIPCWHFLCYTFGSIVGISVATPGNCKMKGHRGELCNFRDIFQRAAMIKKQTAEFLKSITISLETHGITYLKLNRPKTSKQKVTSYLALTHELISTIHLFLLSILSSG